VKKLDKLILIAPGGRLKPQKKNSGTPLAGKLFYNSCTENYKRFPEYTIVFSGAENDIAITARTIHGEHNLIQ